ncbi:hypothetical protein BCR32DRAFT_267730 [Anaeromyces robustus]|uniref:SH3 domain-containing protein n=1 Tax=Anaeromyces robustus TaxID=1754192 RepID=A0A1Y1X960_9FUNG|nr:hypothetical protein BCR32DRAFT_267730 [Anaeromyces robustus]|eukprot:ORX82293.1 hypothetical protein BCR32DRAFT_267730 [Anaeromyces robustus]
MTPYVCLIFLILFFVQVFGEQRLVRTHTFYKGEYYDTIKYEFDITDTQKIGKLDYDVSSDGAVTTLLMNSTEYDEWTNKYYKQWLQQPDYNFSYLNNDLNEFMCRAPVAACKKYDVKYPDRDLYVVILKDPRKEKTYYEYRDDVEKYQNSTTVAKLVYDPMNPPLTTSLPASYSSIVSNVATSIIPSVPTQSSSLTANPNNNSVNNSTSTDNIDNNKDKTNNNNKDNNNNNKDKDKGKSYWYWYLIGGLALLLVLGSIMFAFLNHNKKKQQKLNSNEELHEEDLIIQNDYGKGPDGIETKAAAIPYNPHHAVKRVAYNYKSDDITFERDNIIEITKRYNDGWASAINPKDGKEYLIPLIILEGDLNEDLANIPYEEQSSKNLLATPESLYENNYISQKDYEDMKRNDEWIKKVKLMKQGKPESIHNIIVGGDSSEQFKYLSHPMQETTIESKLIEPDQSMTKGTRKSMVATVVNSNTELLNADHILEVCDEEEEFEYEPEQGVIMKEDNI